MRRAACLGVIAVGLGAALAGAACSSKTTSGTAATPDAGGTSGADHWVIGVSDSLTGGLQGIGGPLQNAVRVAETYINSNGGILGKPVKFVVEDDTSDEGQIAQDTIKKLLGEGAVAVIGPNGSGQVNAVQGLLHDAKTIEISSTATSPMLSAQLGVHDRYFFRTVPPDDFQGKALVNFAVNGPPGWNGSISGDAGAGDAAAPPAGAACKRMALFYYSNVYGTAMAKVVKDNFPTASGGSIVADIQVDPAVASDYSAQVNQIVQSNPDCLAMIIYDDVGDAFLTNLKQAVPNPKFFIIGTDGVYTQSFIDNGREDKANPSSPTIAEGVYGTNPDTNPQRPNPSATDYNDFKNLYVAQFPLPAGATDLDPYTANQFDAAMLIALAIAQAGGTADKVKLRDALYAVSAPPGKPHGPADFIGAMTDIQNGIDIDYKGASGPVNFDDNGNVSAGYIVWHVKDGKFETIQRISPTDLQ